MSVAVRRQGHMGFTILQERLSPVLRRIVVLVSQLLVGVVLVCLLVFGMRVSMANTTQRSAGLWISMALPYSAVPIGSLAGIIQLVPLVLRTIGRDA